MAGEEGSERRREECRQDRRAARVRSSCSRKTHSSPPGNLLTASRVTLKAILQVNQIRPKNKNKKKTCSA